MSTLPTDEIQHVVVEDPILSTSCNEQQKTHEDEAEKGANDLLNDSQLGEMMSMLLLITSSFLVTFNVKVKWLFLKDHEILIQLL